MRTSPASKARTRTIRISYTAHVTVEDDSSAHSFSRMNSEHEPTTMRNGNYRWPLPHHRRSSGHGCVLSHERIAQYAAISGTTVFMYDYALTLPSEVGLIWTPSSGWVGKRVFFFTRYLPTVGLPLLLVDSFASPISSNVCKLARSATTVLQFMLSLSTTAIFGLRICMLYHRERRVVLFITAFGFFSAIAVGNYGATTPHS